MGAMKKIVVKLLLLALPFLVISAICAQLPLNRFSFRVWEALAVHKRNAILTGPFYPNRRITMLEEGGLGHGTPFAISKPATWETDQYGFRKQPDPRHPEIVVIGDSNIVGSNLTQDQTIAEVLQKRLGRCVYPYAPSDINRYLRDPRFRSQPPQVVIFEHFERDMLRIAPLRISKRPYGRTLDVPALIYPAIIFDRAVKLEPYFFLRSRIDGSRLGYRYCSQFFLQGDSVTSTADAADIERTVSILKGYSDYFRQNNITFVYMPLPNKETIFHDLLPSRRQSHILEQVLAKVADEGVVVIDLLQAYQEARNRGAPPYHVDDDHWNEQGVTIAAKLLEHSLQPAGLQQK